MTRDEVVEAVAAAADRTGAAVFVGNGSVARSAATLCDRPETFYMVGSMGLGPVIAAGFAARSDRPVIVLEGDANALMGMSGHPVAARAAAGRPFVHVLADNGHCETTGGQRSLAEHVDFVGVALACGYPRAYEASGAVALRAVLDGALERPSPTFAYVRIELGASPKHPRVPYHPREIRRRFRDAVAA